MNETEILGVFLRFFLRGSIPFSYRSAGKEKELMIF